jgi:hypothetical protein
MGRSYPSVIECDECHKETIKHHCEHNDHCNWYGPCSVCAHVTVMTRGRLGHVELKTQRMRPLDEPGKDK